MSEPGEFEEEPLISFVSEEELFQITGKTRLADQMKVLHAMGIVKAFRHPRGPIRLLRGVYDAWLNPPRPVPVIEAPPRPEWKDTPLGRWQQRRREDDAEIAAEQAAYEASLPKLTKQEIRARDRALIREADLQRAALVRFHSAKRRVAEINRRPPWADMQAIRAIYLDAQRLSRETGIPHHVDHEIPLQGRLVSGLHVHNNLQILTGSENSKKHNHFEVQ